MAATPATMAEALWIGYAGGKNHFNEGIGQGTSGSSGGHTDYPQSDIEAGLSVAARFFLNASFNPTFRINASAGTTSTNTIHPRSELRELLAGGEVKASWDGRSGAHYMKGRSRITEVTDNRPWICFFQIHGSENSPETSDLVRVQTEGTNGTSTNLSIVARRSPPSGGSEIRTVLKTGYNVGTWVSWEIRIDAGRLRIILDGVTVLDVTGMGQIGCYFKVGCYLQDSVGEGAGSSTFGEVEMERGSLQVWHTGYPTPTTPIFTGADDGLGGGTDTTAPTVPQDLGGIRGDTTAQLVWSASTDAVGVTSYKIRRASVEDVGTVTTTANLGKTDDGTGSSTSSANKTVVSTFVAATTGVVTTGHARLWVDTGSASIKMCVYADNGGVPTTLLGLSDALSVTGTSEADRTFTFTGVQQAAIVAGTTYWIGFTWADPGSNNITWSRGATAGVSAQNSSNSASTFGTPGAALSGPIDAYVVVSTSTPSSGSVVAGTSTTTTFTDTGRTNGVAYTYTVTALDAAANESAESDPVTVTPGAPDVTPPTTPGTPSITVGDRRLSLTWTASTDADTGLKNYVVRRGGTTVASPTTNSFVDIELNNGVSYSYTISAVDNSLNESAQSSAAVAVPAAPPIGGVPFLTNELGRGAALCIEVAFGANLAADSSTWTWTDITADVRQDPGISTRLGRNDESGTSNPADFDIVLTNTSGDYSIGGRSRRWPYIRRNTPVRLRIDPADRGGGRVVFMGGANGWTPGWDSKTGKIPVVTLSASGTLRRLGQGDSPINSAFRRAMTALSSVVAYWPMEEGRNATYAPALRGGGDMQVIGTPDWASDDTFYCSDSLPQIKDGQLTAYPAPYASTGSTQIRFLELLPEDPADIPAGAFICSIFCTGSAARWDIVWSPTNFSPGSTGLTVTSSSGTQLLDEGIGFDILGKPGRMSLELVESGGNINWSLGITSAVPGAVAGYLDGTITGQTVGTVSWVQFGATRNLKDTVIGHLTIENAITSLFTSTDALIAFQGEYASSGNTNPFRSRIERLCSENSVPLTRYTASATIPANGLTSFDTVGPQLVNPLLTLLREAEAADMGQLWDGRSNGLSYTTRRRREQGTVRITIDALSGQLGGNFAPVDDDQRTTNRVEVKRTFGVTQTWEDSTGPMGTGAIGFYDDSATVNIGQDSAVIQHAQWRVALGTVGGMRYPSVTIDLRASPQLAATVLDLIPGERVDVINVDDVLDGFTSSTVSLIVEGIKHEITGTSWEVTLLCSPFEGWAVGQVAAETGDTSDMCMRLDTDGATLAALAGVRATALSVATTGTGALWTTNSDDFPFVLSVGGLPVRVTACSGSSSPQTFTCDPLIAPLAAGLTVELWEPRRVGMGSST